ncbi:chemotaxis protein CheX [Pseudokineococcus lusitanus]|uniref:Chemotaxis phosphatase CheX-like protein n=1 Tax=Pseudokineococcus lusitanus TaxID=763993 RepID=A0A3N1HR23_9ACTN|nr:chemotaxis protein CheX [Pseudokineococcus lusitanus]ROP44876.1 chemotaxis phosphatase CheX-like protein [Pseudokineococcus lusitanus]
MSAVPAGAPGPLDPPAPRPRPADLCHVLAALWGSLDPGDGGPGGTVDLDPAPWPADPAVPLHLGQVDVDGPWRGRVVVAADEVAAVRWARAMLALGPDDEVTPEDVHDVVGELANVVAGAVKGHLPPGCRLGLPVVGRGTLGDPPPVPADGGPVAAALAWPDARPAVLVVTVDGA